MLLYVVVLRSEVMRVFGKLDDAKAFVGRRVGRPIDWVYNGGHGGCWTWRDYSIQETEMA